MNKYYRFALVACTALSLSAPALADGPGKIDGAALEKQAEQLLESEPNAQEVTVRVEVAPEVPMGDKFVNFDEFDTNKDGILTQSEVGKRLFKMFDRDGNEVIDNIEMKKPKLVVFAPIDKKTTEIINYQSADMPTKQTVTHEEFMQQSRLAHFDKNKDGLSPLDFLDMTFYRVNVHKDGVIDLYEWERAYAESVRPRHEEPFNYNN